MVLVFGLETAAVSWLTRQLRDGDHPAVAVRVQSDLPETAAHAIVAAADAGVHLVSATRGMDGTFGEYWNLLAEAGKARFVAVYDLGPASLDINGVAAIASRVLEEESFPTTMPLLDDDEAVIGVLDVTTGEQWFPDGSRQPPRTDFDEAVELETNAVLDAAATAGEGVAAAIANGTVTPAITVDVASRAGVDWLARHLPARQVPAATTVLPGEGTHLLIAAGQDGVGLGPVLSVEGERSQPATIRTLVDVIGMQIRDALQPGEVGSATIEPAPEVGAYVVGLE